MAETKEVVSTWLGILHINARSIRSNVDEVEAAAANAIVIYT